MPYYLSWHTALFHYGLLEQQSSTIFCAVTRRKRSAEFHGFQVRFVTLRHDRFFGIEPASGYGGRVRIATVERALLDALERPELSAPFPVVIGAFADAAASGMLDAERLRCAPSLYASSSWFRPRCLRSSLIAWPSPTSRGSRACTVEQRAA